MKDAEYQQLKPKGLLINQGSWKSLLFQFRNWVVNRVGWQNPFGFGLGDDSGKSLGGNGPWQGEWL